jgi:hypothetical protein
MHCDARKSAAQNLSKLHAHALCFAFALSVPCPMKIMLVRGDVFVSGEQRRLSDTAVRAGGLPCCRNAGNAADIAPNSGCVESNFPNFISGMPQRPGACLAALEFCYE